MTEYIVGHVLKAITYYHLLLKICTCSTIRECATIKINHENEVICTQIVMHCATIQICGTNWVNTVQVFWDIINNKFVNSISCIMFKCVTLPHFHTLWVSLIRLAALDLPMYVCVHKLKYIIWLSLSESHHVRSTMKFIFMLDYLICPLYSWKLFKCQTNITSGTWTNHSNTDQKHVITSLPIVSSSRRLEGYMQLFNCSI